MENHTIVTLKKGEGRTIKAGGAWIFDNEIDTITGTFTNGDIVVVHDFDGYPMGRGFINQNLARLISCRVLQWTNTQMCLWWSVWHLEWSSLR